MRRRLALLCALLAGAAIAGPVGPAQAAPKPTITTLDTTIAQGAMMHVEGSGCAGVAMVAVLWTSDRGTPDENVFGIDFPITPDAEGNFESSASSESLEVGTPIDVVAMCGPPGTTPTSDPLELTVVESEPCGEGMPGPFIDVPGAHVFCEDIVWLVDEGVTTGFSNGSFGPGAAVTRQSMAAFLYRVAGEPEGENPGCASAPFDDVPVSHAFCGEIAWLVGDGIANGYGDGGFHPAAPVSRQSMAAFLYRFAVSPEGTGPTCTTQTFPDVPTDHLFCGYIDWLVDVGITGGYSDGTFRPGVTVSRGSMAAFLHRLDEV